jgi:hypothetical protein
MVKVDYVAYEPAMLEVSKAQARAPMLELLADGRTASAAATCGKDRRGSEDASG